MVNRTLFVRLFIERKNENHTMPFIAASYHMANTIIIVVMISRKNKMHFKNHKAHCTAPKYICKNKRPPINFPLREKNDNSIVGADKRLFIIIYYYFDVDQKSISTVCA